MAFEVQQTRWDRIIRRVSGSVGPGSRVSETLSELFPVLDVERVPGELLLLGGTRICHATGTLQAGAGVAPKAMLFNPVDSGALLTISDVQVASSGASIIRWGVVNIQFLPVVGNQSFRDTRIFGQGRPIGEISQLAEVALADATCQMPVQNNVFLPLPHKNSVAVLAPGTGLEVGSNTNATQLFVTFYWRERPAEQSELQF